MIEEEKELDTDDYELLFNSIGFNQSKKIVYYLMDKVLLMGEDYTNPKRLDLINQLKKMRPIYNTLFKTDFI
jgi:hypothetical protein